MGGSDDDHRTRSQSVEGRLSPFRPRVYAHGQATLSSPNLSSDDSPVKAAVRVRKKRAQSKPTSPTAFKRRTLAELSLEKNVSQEALSSSDPKLSEFAKPEFAFFTPGSPDPDKLSASEHPTLKGHLSNDELLFPSHDLFSPTSGNILGDNLLPAGGDAFSSASSRPSSIASDITRGSPWPVADDVSCHSRGSPWLTPEEDQATLPWVSENGGKADTLMRPFNFSKSDNTSDGSQTRKSHLFDDDFTDSMCQSTGNRTNKENCSTNPEQNTPTPVFEASTLFDSYAWTSTPALTPSPEAQFKELPGDGGAPLSPIARPSSMHCSLAPSRTVASIDAEVASTVRSRPQSAHLSPTASPVVHCKHFSGSERLSSSVRPRPASAHLSPAISPMSPSKVSPGNSLSPTARPRPSSVHISPSLTPSQQSPVPQPWPSSVSPSLTPSHQSPVPQPWPSSVSPSLTPMRLSPVTTDFSSLDNTLVENKAGVSPTVLEVSQCLSRET